MGVATVDQPSPSSDAAAPASDTDSSAPPSPMVPDGQPMVPDGQPCGSSATSSNQATHDLKDGIMVNKEVSETESLARVMTGGVFFSQGSGLVPGGEGSGGCVLPERQTESGRGIDRRCA